MQLKDRQLQIVLSLCLGIALFGSGCKDKTEKVDTTTSSPAATSSTATTTAKSAQIDINSAPIAELDKLELPGTKPSLSERIQGGRPYKTIDDLVTKKVISQDEFKLIKGLIVAGKTK